MLIVNTQTVKVSPDGNGCQKTSFNNAYCVAGAVQGLSQALTMSLTSTSSDSEQVSLEDFLESCRAPTLLAELDDDEEMGAEDDDNDDDDENEDDAADYEEVMVSRNLLSFMEEEGFETGR